jgi:hypothetical protein
METCHAHRFKIQINFKLHHYENLHVFGDFSFAAASSSAADWILGGVTRDTL